MLDVLKLVNNPENITDEQVTQAYDFIKEYCDKNNLDVMETLNDDKNIPIAVKEIYSNIPRMARFVIKEKTIAEIITKNIDFIRQKAKEKNEAEK